MSGLGSDSIDNTLRETFYLAAVTMIWSVLSRCLESHWALGCEVRNLEEDTTREQTEGTDGIEYNDCV